jgi:hypothetical protein
MLLALGTFVAGVHVSWHICALGIATALFVPAIAWLTESALFLVLGAVALIGVGMTFWWRLSDRRISKVPSEESPRLEEDLKTSARSWRLGIPK